MQKALVSLAVMAAACGGGAATSDTVADTTATILTTTTTSEASTTTTAPTTTTTVDEWDSVDTWRGGLAGEYRTALFEPAFRFTTPAAFTVLGPELSDVLDIAKGEASLSALLLPPDTVDGTVDLIAAKSGVEIIAGPEPIDIGGAAGVEIEASNEGAEPLVSHPDGSVYTFVPGAKYTFHIVEVRNEIVAFAIEVPPGTPPNIPQQFQDIIDSVVWKDLS